MGDNRDRSDDGRFGVLCQNPICRVRQLIFGCIKSQVLDYQVLGVMVQLIKIGVCGGK